MKTMFDTITINSLSLKNRIIRSGTFEYNGAKSNGDITPDLLKYYEGLSEGGVGLIITGMMAIDNNSRHYSGMVNIYNTSFVPKFSEIAQKLHTQNTKIIVQLAHAGVKASLADSGIALGPSRHGLFPGKRAKEMSIEDIHKTVDAFGKAAIKCKISGADGIQIHCAHGYLLSQFLSPIYNKRRDEYGGDIRGRSRIVFEVIDTVRKYVGEDYPIWVKINSSDLHEDGFSFIESLYVCEELVKKGVDAIEVSGGIANSLSTLPCRPVKNENQEGSFLKETKEIAFKITVPIISAGGYRSPQIIDRVLNTSNIVAISLSRPLICEPEIVNRWKSGDMGKAVCISCNRCLLSSKKLKCILRN